MIAELLARVPLALRAGLAWDRARQFAAAGRHAEALGVIDALPSEATQTLHFKLLRLQQLYALGNDEEASVVAPVVFDLIEGADKVSANERRYLRAYANILARATVSLDDIDLRAVRESLRAHFPLRRHPEWTA
ncbi:MAG: hypothetical protein AB7O98_18800 [Hyphomonadaceae bacterium]